jgi:putative oxidoreductase
MFTTPRWGLVPLRLVVGFGFLAHGWAKWSRGPAAFAKLLAQIGVPLPQVTAWVVTLTEILGGIALMLGALVAIVSLPLIVSMLVAMFTVQLRFGFSSVNTIGLTPEGPVFGPPGYEINLLYIGALVALATAGPSPGQPASGPWRPRRNYQYAGRSPAAAPQSQAGTVRPSRTLPHSGQRTRSSPSRARFQVLAWNADPSCPCNISADAWR